MGEGQERKRAVQELGARLREARARAGYTQAQLAEYAGVDRATISLIENGHEAPRSDTLSRLARALGVEMAQLWRDSRPKESPGERYESLEHMQLHPGLQELLDDETARLMLNISPEEEQMLKSIRTRTELSLPKQFFIDVLVAYRRQHRDA